MTISSDDDGLSTVFSEETLRFVKDASLYHSLRYGLLLQDSEDVAQTVLLEVINAWNRRDSTELQGLFSDTRRLHAWLFTVIRNVAATLAKRKHRRAEVQDSKSLLQTLSQFKVALDLASLKEEKQVLKDAIRRLSYEDQRVIDLHLQGLTAANIAKRLNLSVAAVRQRLSRARNRLAKLLRTA